MSVFTEIKNLSDTATRKILAQFGDLPSPLRAAIGAGDIAIEHLANLRDQVKEKVGDHMPTSLSAPDAQDMKDFAAGLPERATTIAREVAARIETLASETPGKVQHLVAELPGKVSEVANSFSPENIKTTLESYTQFVAHIYDNLTERGDDITAQAREDAADKDAEEAPAPAATAKKTAAKKPTAKKPAAKKTAATTAATATPASKKPAAKKTAAQKPAAKKSATKKSETTQPVTKPAATDSTTK